MIQKLQVQTSIFALFFRNYESKSPTYHLSRHDQAIEYARNAIRYIERAVRRLKGGGAPNFVESLSPQAQESVNEESKQTISPSVQEAAEPSAAPADVPTKEAQEENSTNLNSIFTTRIIAYYNLAVEYEHVGILSESVKMFKKALELSCSYNGEDDALTRIIQANLEKVRDKKDQRQNLHLMRSLERNEKATKHFFHDSEHIRNIQVSLVNRRRVQLLEDRRKQISMSSSRRLGRTATVGARAGEGQRSMGGPVEVRSVRSSARSIAVSAGHPPLRQVKSKESKREQSSRKHCECN